MDGEGMAHRMRSDRLADTREPARLLANQRNRVSGDRLTGHVAFEEPSFWPHGAPVAPQCLQQFGGQHHIAILLALALIDTNHHSLTIDVTGLQMNSL